MSFTFVPFYSHPPSPHSTPPPLVLNRERARLWQGAGRGLGSWRSVCFGLIPAFLLQPGLGPQIWHFLFGLGQRSSALEALTPDGEGCSFPSSHDPSSPPLLLQSAPSCLLPDSHRGQALGGTKTSGWANPPFLTALTSTKQMRPEDLKKSRVTWLPGKGKGQRRAGDEGAGSPQVVAKLIPLPRQETARPLGLLSGGLHGSLPCARPHRLPSPEPHQSPVVLQAVLRSENSPWGLAFPSGRPWGPWGASWYLRVLQVSKGAHTWMPPRGIAPCPPSLLWPHPRLCFSKDS